MASFLSIAVIAMLAVTVYLGVDFAADAMDKNVSDYYHHHNMQDLQVISPILLTEDDLDEIRALDGVSDVEGIAQTNAWIAYEKGKLQIAVLSMPQRIAVPEILEGTPLQSPDECMIEDRLAQELGLKIGDRISLEEVTGETLSLLNASEFTVSGIFSHPEHITDKVSYSFYVIVGEDVFNQDLLQGNWPMARITLSNLPDNYFTKTYLQQTSPVEDSLRELSTVRTPLREAEIHDTIEKQISDGETELNEAKAKLDDAEEQLKSAEAEIEENEEKITEGEKQLADGEAQIKDGEAQIKDGEAKLRDGELQLRDAEIQIANAEQKIREAEEQAADSIQQLEEGKAKLAEAERLLGLAPGQLAEAERKLNETRSLLDMVRDLVDRSEGSLRDILELLYSYLEDRWEKGRIDYYYSGEEYLDGLIAYKNGKEAVEEGEAKLQELTDARAQLDEKKQEYEDGKAELEEKRGELIEKKHELASGKEELEESRRELEEGKQKIAEARTQLEEKRQEYDKGLKEYEEYREKLANARNQLASLASGAWIIRNNNSDIGFVYCKTNSGSLASLSVTFSLLFILIAALVIYASVGRMVDEQSVLVGTTKALGLLKKEILVKYMLFGVLATMLGVVLGILIAYFVFEPLILHMYAPYYLMPEAPKRFLTVPTLIVVAGGFLLSYLAVRIACGRLLKLPAIELMKGTGSEPKRKDSEKKEKEGKESSKSSLYSSLIIKNMTSDLKRVIVTMVSIMGCCMLLMVGFSLKYGEDRIVDRQFGGVMAYDVDLEYTSAAETAETELAGILDDLGTEYIKVQKTTSVYSYNDELGGAVLICADPDTISGYYNLINPKTKEEIRIPEHGVLIPKRMHEFFGIEIGDTINFYDSGFYPHEGVVAGIFDNYFGRMIFVSPEAYHEIFGTTAANNCYYVKLNGCEVSALNTAVRNTEGFLNLSDAAASRTQIENTAKALNALIIVMIVMAGLMAFFILFNLSGSYMIHKKKELTVMRINGFTYKETKRYASTELIITSLLGILLGIPLGAALGSYVMRLTEQTDVQMVRSVDIRTILFSALITALFSAFINGLALRKIRSLKLSDMS